MSEEVLVFRVSLNLLNLFLIAQYVMVRSAGKTAINSPSEQNLFNHRSAAALLVILSLAIIVVVGFLEFLLRKESNYIAPLTVLFTVHLTCALVYFVSILLMRFWLHGRNFYKLHVMMGKHLIPWSMGGMILTGTVLMVYM